MKWWNWLSGKKSAIGGFLFLLSWGITEILIGEWGIATAVLPKIVGTLDKIAALITGTGGGHKAVKFIKTKLESRKNRLMRGL